MHKTDLIWGGHIGGHSKFLGGACAPPGPLLATPLKEDLSKNPLKDQFFKAVLTILNLNLMLWLRTSRASLVT